MKNYIKLTIQLTILISSTSVSAEPVFLKCHVSTAINRNQYVMQDIDLFYRLNVTNCNEAICPITWGQYTSGKYSNSILSCILNDDLKNNSDTDLKNRKKFHSNCSMISGRDFVEAGEETKNDLTGIVSKFNVQISRKDGSLIWEDKQIKGDDVLIDLIYFGKCSKDYDRTVIKNLF